MPIFFFCLKNCALGYFKTIFRIRLRNDITIYFVYKLNHIFLILNIICCKKKKNFQNNVGITFNHTPAETVIISSNNNYTYYII